MDKNYHVSGSQMDGESFKQKDDDQSEKDERVRRVRNLSILLSALKDVDM